MPCPNEQQLRAYRTGELPHLTLSAIADHLEQCPRCENLLQELDTDVDPKLAGPQHATPQHGPTRMGAAVAAAPAAAKAGEYPFLSPAVQPDEIGRLGNYRVLRLLGKGGMAYVFHAEDIALRRPVALKVMKPELSHDGEGWQRFLREARIMAAVKHEHLVTVYQVGQEGSTVYLAMELLQGESLGSRMDRGQPTPLPEILRLGREIASGLDFVHGQGLVHRDIKPDNIWLEAPEDRVKILDFGLARLATSDVRLTQAGTIMGTPAFMAPEQARGQTVDARADLFSLGCVLYALCGGKRPFEADDTMAMLSALALDVPPPIDELNPALPPAFAALVMELLAKEPALRPATAQEVVERIEAIEKTPAATSKLLLPAKRRASSGNHTRRWLLALAVAVAGIIGLVLLSRGGGTAPVEARKAPTPTAIVPKKLPVKVFLLAGQSNMAGKGMLRTLDWLGADPQHGALLKKIKNADGSWTTRKDVWVYYPRDRDIKSGPLTVGFGDSDNEIGPELLLGQALGDHFDNQVLLIKVTQGNMSLAVECRPPSSGGTEGPFFRRMIQTVRNVMDNPDLYFPQYRNQGMELAGFIWFQAWNDMNNPQRSAEYGPNLINLIKDVRRELNAPNLPVVIGELGVDGVNANAPILGIRAVQTAVARRGEFNGTVILAPTADCWDYEAAALVKKSFIGRQWKDKADQEKFDKMGSNIEYLYLGSGKIFARIGQSFGDAMKKVMK